MTEAPVVVKTQEEIANEWLAQKKVLVQAAADLLRIELELLKLIPAKPEGGSTHNINGFKISLTGNINRKVDWTIFDKVVADLKAENPAFPVPEKPAKRELDETGIKWFQANEPGIYFRLSQAITAKPGKTTVEIVRTE